MDQRTDEWYQARLGKVTASRLADVLAKIKTGEAAARANYRIELVAERLTGTRAQSFTSASMQWGIDYEQAAVAEYELATGRFIRDCGFIQHPTIIDSGASPDGLVGDDGLIEVKCPETKTHINTLLTKQVPAQYLPQMQWQLACTGRGWADFVSYDPRIPQHLQTAIIRVERDQKLIDEYTVEVNQFLDEVLQVLQRLG
jgi:putative phage-type endonuclease